MAEGAEPLKPLVEILLAAILINKTVVAGFRGDKNEEEVWRMICSKCKEEIFKYGRGTKHYWGSCGCADWKLVRA